MAIVHDLAESLAGDIAPSSGMSKADKYALEAKAMAEIVETLGSTPEALEIQSLWLEYEEGTSPEAIVCKDLDKFEMIVQALEYEKRDQKTLESFFESTKGKFQNPTVKEWVNALYEERGQHQSASNR
ncbi:HD domain-containing protein 2 [Quaeritorhiza haematococci]|nr:HD domain-containing protein 2 [Quaeritorhiza haematococci]